MKPESIIHVTEPSLPSLDEYVELLEEVWRRKWITNKGQYHKQLEEKLAEHLCVKHLSLFCNGTIALQVGLKALGVEGEVITTPFSFPATSHSLWWNHCTPVFCDVDPVYGNLDPDRIEELITPKTTALLPVHVYGNPCNHRRIREIAARHGLKVLYDAAHCFGVKLNGESVLNWGDLSMISFHATKVFNTAEGGALVTNDPAMKDRIDKLKNFGFAGETSVIASGTNGKMSELHAALGIANLGHVDENMDRRLAVDAVYRRALESVPGCRVMPVPECVERNGAYFPIFIDEDAYGLSRDRLFGVLKEHDIWARRYFYPLISEFDLYRDLPSAQRHFLQNACMLGRQVICLPIHPRLNDVSANWIAAVVRDAAQNTG